MAYRAAVLGAHRAGGVIAIGGDIPPELKTSDAAGRRWPSVLLATGRSDPWCTPERLAGDAAVLEQRGILHETCLFDGGHEWTTELRDALGVWLEARRP
jgi:predicted esterase